LSSDSLAQIRMSWSPGQGHDHVDQSNEKHVYVIPFSVVGLQLKGSLVFIGVDAIWLLVKNKFWPEVAAVCVCSVKLYCRASPEVLLFENFKEQSVFADFLRFTFALLWS